MGSLESKAELLKRRPQIQDEAWEPPSPTETHNFASCDPTPWLDVDQVF